jgi:hypothetical protein
VNCEGQQKKGSRFEFPLHEMVWLLLCKEEEEEEEVLLDGRMAVGISL